MVQVGKGKQKELFEGDWIPLNDNILLEPIGVLPELYKAKVMAVGPGMITFNGERVPMDVKVGDVVIVGRYVCDSLFKGTEQKHVLLARGFQVRLKLKEEQEAASGKVKL